MNRQIVSVALKVSFPVFVGYMAIGIGFGVLFANAGYPWWLALVCSVLMYAGSGQYFAVALFSAGASLSEIFVVEFLLGIRHIFYGLSLISKYRGAGKYKPYLMFAITDETFALLQGVSVPKNVEKYSFYFLVSLLDYMYWCVGSVIGAVGYAILERHNLSGCLMGVDFALTSLFIVMLIEQLKASKDFLPAIFGGLFGIFAVILFKGGVFGSSNIIWTAICASFGAMFLFRGPQFFRLEETDGKIREGDNDSL